MEEKLNKKLLYLHSMADKYEKLNQKTHYKYLWRFNGICEHIQALENLQNDITGEWNEAYYEDLKESEV
ncbi:hypothetical protein [Clostridium neonatale]|uniref:hypothetical protein n=1 Tax=Clostridium neonatale TaxID=137838 RepID=UPI00291B4C72|nr:conserved hypothetical protein [Clostridium neonatale]